jgi:hypothetical protein
MAVRRTGRGDPHREYDDDHCAGYQAECGDEYGVPTKSIIEHLTSVSASRTQLTTLPGIGADLKVHQPSRLPGLRWNLSDRQLVLCV